MRYINLDELLEKIFRDDAGKKALVRLIRACKKTSTISQDTRLCHIRKNGPNKWKPIKDLITAEIGHKCWYTEVELVGASLTVDHYRPINEYWWLAYDQWNYRIACPWANSPEYNLAHHCNGGKGANFPLLPPGQRATCKEHVSDENPVILDPCNPDDCKLVAFQADGRPVLNPLFSNVPSAITRIEESMVLLNLDHPAFNSKREQLYHDITNDVNAVEGLAPNNTTRLELQHRLAQRLDRKAPFSTAARFYLSMYRDHEWVQAILDAAS